MADSNHSSTGKRIDVGYKRPPVEHQFKPGNKPRPRKKRSTKRPSDLELVIKLLNEQQRVEIGGKVRWCTKARLLIMVAFKLAEKGNPTLSRALTDLLLKDVASAEANEPWLQIEQEDGTFVTTTMSGQPVDFEAYVGGRSSA